MKALRQSVKKTARNQQVKGGLAYLRRMARKAIEAKDAKTAADLAKQVVKAVDKAIQKKVIKKNTGARIKSRLMGHVASLGKK